MTELIESVLFGGIIVVGIGVVLLGISSYRELRRDRIKL